MRESDEKGGEKKKRERERERTQKKRERVSDAREREMRDISIIRSFKRVKYKRISNMYTIYIILKRIYNLSLAIHIFP